MTSPRSRRELSNWIKTHVEQYLATHGEDGHLWRGVTTLPLTTTGRRSGESLLLPLIYGEDAGTYVIVASRGGGPKHPDWFTNLVASPAVQVQVKGDRFAARARTATEEEKPTLWKLMASIWPAYDGYQTKTERPIPVAILERS